MTNPADIRVVTCNAKKELHGADVRKVVAIAAEHADVIFWQEIETQTHRIAVRSLAGSGFATYWPGGAANAVPISYRRGRFRIVKKARRILHLGRRGVTPSRWTTFLVLDDLLTRQRFAAQNLHLISQAWTSHPERRALWTKGARKAGRLAARLVKNRGALVGGGDMNRDQWAPKGTVGVWTDHGTYGNAHYDTLFFDGAMMLVGEPKRLPTASDHDALQATFRRTT